MKTAVLVIDVQQGLCEGADKAFECEHVIERINVVTHRARNWGASVIFVQHESSSGHLQHGTRAWELAAGLHVVPGDIRLRKATPDAFLRTDLEAILRETAVCRLIVCGMHTEFCVDTTIRRALALGYPVVLVADAHTSRGNAVLTAQQIIDHHNLTLAEIESFGPRVTTLHSDEV